jgi:small subunit ribosomal protein S4
MGDIKRKRRKYSRPKKLFDSVRIKEENKIVSEYGLKNKREIWKAKSVTSKFRKRAKNLISKTDEDKNKFIEKLNKLGIGVKDISDILGLTEKDVLDRRLQTILFKKKMANTAKQARQVIVHKYVIVAGNVVNSPSFWVTKELEGQIEVKPQKKKAPEVKDEAPTAPEGVPSENESKEARSPESAPVEESTETKGDKE